MVDNGWLLLWQDMVYLQEIVCFVKIMKSGDKVEFVSVLENVFVWLMVMLMCDNCFGQECLYYKECFVMQVWCEVQQVDIVVVNYYLFFVDIMLCDMGMVELLLNVNMIIFDEVYQLLEMVMLFFGEMLLMMQIFEFVCDMVVEGLSYVCDVVEWVKFGGDFECVVCDLCFVFVNDQIVCMLFVQFGDDYLMFGVFDVFDVVFDVFVLVFVSQVECVELFGVCLWCVCELQDLLVGWVVFGVVEVVVQVDVVVVGDNVVIDGDLNEKVCWVEVFVYIV